jgi:hypothetical protein
MGWMGSHNIKMMNVRQDSVNRHSRSTAHNLDIQSLPDLVWSFDFSQQKP